MISTLSFNGPSGPDLFPGILDDDTLIYTPTHMQSQHFNFRDPIITSDELIKNKIRKLTDRFKNKYGPNFMRDEVPRKRLSKRMKKILRKTNKNAIQNNDNKMHETKNGKNLILVATANAEAINREKLLKTIKIMEANKIDILGLQETHDSQKKYTSIGNHIYIKLHNGEVLLCYQKGNISKKV